MHIPTTARPARSARQAKAETPARKLADARLEARVTVEQKAQLQKAAELSGRSLSDFVVASAQENARRVLQQHEAIALSRKGQIAFVSALLAPSKPNAHLRKAAATYRNRMGF